MTWELSFRPEPFTWPQELEWEDETSRSDPDYIRSGTTHAAAVDVMANATQYVRHLEHL